jgi:hypothetical protein
VYISRGDHGHFGVMPRATVQARRLKKRILSVRGGSLLPLKEPIREDVFIADEESVNSATCCSKILFGSTQPTHVIATIAYWF